ncbi:MAG: TolC family protein [Phycisphaerales bacterium]
MWCSRMWLALLLPVLLAGGCSLHPRWPDPEGEAARLTGAKPIVIDMTGGQLDAPGPEQDALTQAQAMRLALTTDPSIQTALARVRLAYAEAQQERLLPNPILTVLVKFPTAGGAPIVEPSIAADLLALVQKPGKVKAADHRLRAASAEAVTAVLDALALLQDRYVEAQALDALIPVLEERRRLIDRLLEIAQSRLKGGEGTRLDVTTLETQKVELEVEIAERTLERREARLELARLIGRPSDAAEWKLEAWTELAAAGHDESAWVGAGLEHRPEIIAKMWELSALGVEFRLARWSIFDGTEIGADAEGTAEPGTDDWAAGPALAVPIPIFDWGQARQDAAAAKRLEAAHQLTQTRRQVVEEIRRAYWAFRVSLEVYGRVKNQLIPMQERRRQEAESQYRAGQSDVIPLILADQDLQTARAKLVDLERKASVSLVRLQRAVGGAGVVPTQPLTQPADVRPTTQPN